MFIIAIVAIIVFAVKYHNQKKYEESLEFHLLQIGYDLNETKVIEDKLDKNETDIILKKEYNEHIDDFIQEKYFIFNNLDKYLDYKKENKKTDYSKIVSIINTEANIEWIENERETDLSKEELMLVNRIYSLGEYEP
jgi:hypothetical protein